MLKCPLMLLACALSMKSITAVRSGGKHCPRVFNEFSRLLHANAVKEFGDLIFL